MSEKIRIHVEKDFEIGKIDERLFSSFAEHLGRCIYTGLYEPTHPLADELGFRKDVIELVNELHVSHIRYPGGNFLSGYDWKDGIGPKDKRPRRLDLAWKTIESNQFGIDEFFDWTKKSGTKIMAAVNMGTGTPKDAAEMVEYCNYPGGTYWSDLRIANGHKDPYDIKLWCIGNEMDGDWQICHLDSQEYGKKARETAKMMKWVDDSIEVVVSGSSNREMATFPQWDREILELTYDQADYLSIHRYFENEGNDQDFLASFKDMDNFIAVLSATADYVKAYKRSNKTMMLSFDEWNVWYQKNQKPHPWMEAPEILEDQYSLLDALTFAGMGMSLINHSDRVRIACLAQIVNVIAPIFTEKNGRIVKQSTFYPFKYLSLYGGKGVALKPVVHTPKLETKHGDAEVVYTTAVYDEETKMVTLFCLNIGEEAQVLDIDLNSFGKLQMVERIMINGNDLSAFNNFDHPSDVMPKFLDTEKEIASKFEIEIPKRSWTVLRFEIK